MLHNNRNTPLPQAGSLTTGTRAKLIQLSEIDAGIVYQIIQAYLHPDDEIEYDHDSFQWWYDVLSKLPGTKLKDVKQFVTAYSTLETEQQKRVSDAMALYAKVQPIRRETQIVTHV